MTEMRQGFLMMPFDSKLDWLHDELKEVASQVNIELTRADDISQPGVIIQQILDSIDDSDVVVAVCTGKNPNVFFELGYAWWKHDPVLVAESEDDLPFDVSAYRTVMYGDRHAHSWQDGFRSSLFAAVRLQTRQSDQDSAKLSAVMRSGGEGEYWLEISNTGTISMYQVSIELPDDIGHGFYLSDFGMPIDEITPGATASLLASISFGLEKPNFIVTVSAQDESGREYSFRETVSIYG